MLKLSRRLLLLEGGECQTFRRAGKPSKDLVLAVRSREKEGELRGHLGLSVVMLQVKNIFVELETRLTVDSKTNYEDGGEGGDHVESNVGKRIN